MKARTLLILSTILVLFTSSPAITVADLAGTYVGQRTATSAAGVNRYDIITTSEADGFLTNYVELGGVVYALSGYITVAPDGTITSGGGDTSHLTLNGKHLDIVVEFFNYFFF